jgi:hypothetical protein
MYKKKAKPLKALTPAQKDKLKKHSVHHTKKHMEQMRKDMRKGLSFSKAHQKAMKDVGR